MKPTKQTIYLPVDVKNELPLESCKCGIIKNGEFELSYFIKTPNYTVFDHVKSGLSHNKSEITHWLKEQEVFVFTQEQLNEYTANVIRQALEAAAEKAVIRMKEGMDFYYEDYIEGVDKQSITDTLEETFKLFKI